MASVSSHTGSVTVKNRTNNGSDVVLGDRRKFKTQRSDPLKTWSYVMIVRHVTHLKVPSLLNRCKIRILAGHGVLIFLKSLEKRSAVLAYHGMAH